MRAIFKPTATNRFNRWLDRVKNRHAKFENWEAIDFICNYKKDLMYLYKLGYEQGKRDLSKERERSR